MLGHGTKGMVRIVSNANPEPGSRGLCSLEGFFSYGRGNRTVEGKHRLRYRHGRVGRENQRGTSGREGSPVTIL